AVAAEEASGRTDFDCGSDGGFDIDPEGASEPETNIEYDGEEEESSIDDGGFGGGDGYYSEEGTRPEFAVQLYGNSYQISCLKSTWTSGRLPLVRYRIARPRGEATVSFPRRNTQQDRNRRKSLRQQRPWRDQSHQPLHAAAAIPLPPSPPPPPPLFHHSVPPVHAVTRRCLYRRAARRLHLGKAFRQSTPP
ncbi:hypothetical protein THAOC_36305, partial [Thalassiosira oceanica]